MLTPTDITQQALNKYPQFVESWFAGKSIFPWEVRFGRADPSSSLRQLRQDIELLLSKSHSVTGRGYRVDLAERNLRLHGPQQLPVRVWFENECDYLEFIEKQQPFTQLQADIAAAISHAPILEIWARANARTILNRLQAGEGRPLGLAIQSLHANPHPCSFSREIPLPGVSGKFIESAIDLIADILREIGSPAWKPGKDAHESLSLRKTPRLIRAMILDGGRLDYGTPVDRFTRPEGVLNVLAVENLRSFLTLPAIPNTLAVFGEGKAAQTLSNISWLRDVQLFYWGDIDPHGYAILNALRGEFPAARSVLMDEACLTRYEKLLSPAEVVNTPLFERLIPTERAAAQLTQGGKHGIEQEKLPPMEVAAALQLSIGAAPNA
jgi:hypothetical protein